jgi:hypothetical protein
MGLNLIVHQLFGGYRFAFGLSVGSGGKHSNEIEGWRATLSPHYSFSILLIMLT